MSILINEKSSITPQSTYTNPSDLELEALRDRLGTSVAKAMQEIAFCSENVRNNYLADTKFLDTGVWYGADYGAALAAKNQIIKLHDLRESKAFMYGLLPVQFFEPIFEEDGMQRAWAFLVRKDQLPSEALKAAMKGLSIIDCGMACQISRYKGLCDILGVEKFNRLFSEPHGCRMNLGYNIDDECQPMRYFVSFTQTDDQAVSGSFGNRPIKVGQLIFFHGAPLFRYKHPFSHLSGFNLVCSSDQPGKQLYMGHGVSPDGESEKEVCFRLASGFNAKPDHFIRLPSFKVSDAMAELASMKTDRWKNKQVDIKHPEQVVGGYDASSPQDFCMRLIYDLVHAPLEEISMDFVSQHPFSNQAF